MSPEQLSSLQSATNVLPTLLWLVVLMGFLASLVVGLGAGMNLIFLHAMGRALPRFNENMDKAQAAFEKLQASTEAQLLTQARASEVWHRTRKEQLDEEKKEEKPAERQFPSFKQDWRGGGNSG